MKVKRPMWEQRNMFGARIKIKLEAQLVDPPIHYLTCVIVLWSSALNKPVIPEVLYNIFIKILMFALSINS